MINDESTKKKIFPKIIAAIVVFVMLIAISYTAIIASQHAEFNALDESIANETVTIDKCVEE